MPTSLNNAVDEGIRIKIFPECLLRTVFNILHDEIGSAHKALVLHNDVYWLSPGKEYIPLFEKLHGIEATIFI
jgi:hypothetical protein